MSNVYIRIELDNDPFYREDCGPELARILRDLAGRIEYTDRADLEGSTFTPRDINGNACGTVDFEIDEDTSEEDARILKLRNDGEAYGARLSKEQLVKLLDACDRLPVDDNIPLHRLRLELTDMFGDGEMTEDNANTILYGE